MRLNKIIQRDYTSFSLYYQIKLPLDFSACAKVLLAQMSDLLYLLGEISGKTIFIDGTKIESAANKYTFVWKRADRLYKAAEL